MLGEREGKKQQFGSLAKDLKAQGNLCWQQVSIAIITQAVALGLLMTDKLSYSVMFTPQLTLSC